MKFRVTEVGNAHQVEAWTDGRWVALRAAMESLKSPASRGLNGAAAIDIVAALQLAQDERASLLELLPLAPSVSGASEPVVPLKPSAYRDLSLYEKHSIDAFRGFSKRFAPRVYRTSRIVERLTGKPYHKFLPKPLFYRQPIYYMGNGQNFVPDGAVVEWPHFTQALDYELELGLILVRPLFRATPSEVSAAIGGVVVLNDFSARDVQLGEMLSGFGPQRSKNFANAISIEVVTFDEIAGRLDSLRGEVRINGRLTSTCSSSGPQFGLVDALSILSQSERLNVGEFFGSGTWPGGSGMETGAWLEPGDEISLAIDGVGQVTNRVMRMTDTERRDHAGRKVPIRQSA
jgi:2-keto-4-pentenoate hydratase/2-oxohepta-3-ene-1,7-dioic acid hydratase in catechol pathway